MKYYTPPEIARVLARHAPKHIDRLLEPAVGNGVLLSAMLGRLNDNARVACVDTDSNALEEVKLKFGCHPKIRLELWNNDFLSWTDGIRDINEPESGFDCVILNPPFLGRRSHYANRIAMRNDKEVCRKIPVEIAFLLKGIDLLKHGGRMLAIVPASVTASIAGGWFRSFLLTAGSIKVVHELSNFSFERFEGRIYLLVFEKGAKSQKLVLRNHDLYRPESLSINLRSMSAEKRMDFGFVKARQRHAELTQTTPLLEWVPLGHVATISRGLVGTPRADTASMHTTDFSAGFWGGDIPCTVTIEREASGCITEDDILVKRVSRRCSTTFGIASAGTGLAATDCVLTIRPDPRWRDRILFAVRVLMSLEFGPRLVESGVGATYITESGLRNLLVPQRLFSHYPKLFAKYCQALEVRDASTLFSIEKRVAGYLRRRIFNKKHGVAR